MNDDSVETDFLRKVRSALADPIGRGSLRIVSSRYDAQSFGNAVVVLEGRNLLLRLVRDRSEEFADVQPIADPHEWWGVLGVLRAIGLGTEIKVSPSIDEQAPLINRYLSDLEDAMSPQRYAKIAETCLRMGEEALKGFLEELKREYPD